MVAGRIALRRITSARFYSVYRYRLGDADTSGLHHGRVRNDRARICRSSHGRINSRIPTVARGGQRRTKQDRGRDRSSSRPNRRGVVGARVCRIRDQPEAVGPLSRPALVAGAKDDRRDAFVLADSLRTDQHCFRRLSIEPATVVRLRELARAEQEAGEELRRAANQLFQLLLRYYPQILELCRFPDEPWIWALLDIAPTPEQARRLTLARVRNLLTKHRIRRVTAEEVREVLGRLALPVAAGVTEAISERVLLMLPRLRVDYQQRRQIVERMEALFEGISAPDDEACGSLRRDVAILISIPGVGRVIAAALLTEAFDALSQRDYEALRAHGGTAPVTRRSGKTTQIVMRYGCNQRFRTALYHWARTSVMHDERSKHHYARLRGVGHKHARALRGVADRLLAMLVAMLKAGQFYDAARRAVTPPVASAA